MVGEYGREEINNYYPESSVNSFSIRSLTALFTSLPNFKQSSSVSSLCCLNNSSNACFALSGILTTISLISSTYNNNISDEHINNYKSLISSCVENILILDCLSNAFSLDQIGELKAKANAKYCTSAHSLKESLNLRANASSTFSDNSFTSFSVNSITNNNVGNVYIKNPYLYSGCEDARYTMQEFSSPQTCILHPESWQLKKSLSRAEPGSDQTFIYAYLPM